MMKPIAFKTVPSMNGIRSKLLMLTWLILVSSGVQATPIWHTFGAYEYALTDEYLNFLDAEALAQSQYGAHLASIHSDEENSFILDLVLSTVTADGRYGVVWLGALQTGENSSDPYVWLDGTPVGYWGVQRDNNSGHRALLMFYDYSSHYYAGSWGDWKDSGLSASIVPRGVMKRLTIAADNPPIADAGEDRPVNGNQLVTLDGSGSSDPENDPIAYAWTQLSGTSVTLSDVTAEKPTFMAPNVAETLTFKLEVTANEKTDSDIVNISVVFVNHVPVADAGEDLSIAEDSPVSLDGTGSFDVDNDPLTYKWTQISGSPVLELDDDTTATQNFIAPVLGSGGAPGVVATLVFELVVDDGFPAEVPASDTMTLEITNVNNPPIANAGGDQTRDENSIVVLDGLGSSDPDNDILTPSWVQTGGTTVSLSGANTGTPSFTAPFVSLGGEDLTFELTVDDGYEGGTDSDSVVIHLQNINDPPLASAAEPTIACLWPPNHSLIEVGIIGVTDPDNNATITIDSVFQDEPTNGLGDGDTATDAIINDDGTVLLRAERSGKGNGRVYHVRFTASDFEGSASGEVEVCVPPSKRKSSVDGGELYDSTN